MTFKELMAVNRDKWDYYQITGVGVNLETESKPFFS